MQRRVKKKTKTKKLKSLESIELEYKGYARVTKSTLDQIYLNRSYCHSSTAGILAEIPPLFDEGYTPP